MFRIDQVSKKIVAYRKENNLTQTELADKMGVSFQAVSNWERGNSMPDISKLPLLADIFGCSVDDLLEEESELLYSAMKDNLPEYVENHEISREELEAVVPVLKPGQVAAIANGILLKNGDRINLFYPFLDDETLEELAERKSRNDESIQDMLPFLRKGFLRKIALEQYERGMKVSMYYPFLDKDALRELAKRKIEREESIQDMLPFLGKKSLREFALEQYEKGMKVSMYYPFLDKDTLRELAKRKIEREESIQDMLPFLGKDFLKAIVLG